MINIDCPNCHIELDLDEDLQGEEVNCPECNALFGVPYQPIVEQEVVMAVPKKKGVSRPMRRKRLQQPMNPNNPVMTTDKSERSIETACWVLYVITFIVIAVPYFPTFWLWMPLAIAGGICTIIAFVKARYITGVLGIVWTLMGIPIWWFISGLLTVAIFGAAGAAAAGDEGAGVDDNGGKLFNNPFAEAREIMDKAEIKAQLEADKADMVAAAETQAYIPLIEILEFKSKYIETFRNDKVAAVQLRLKNKGKKTIKRLTITVYFLDASGATIYDDTMYPVNSGGYRGKPLKPGYLTSMGDKWSTFAKCPPEWKEGSVKYAITEIEFE